MKRLTRSNPSGSASFIMGGETIPTIMTTYTDMQVVLDRLAAYEDTGLEPEEIFGLCSMSDRAKMADLLRLEEYQALGSIDHLREIASADKEDRLVVLPVKEGTKIYRLGYRLGGTYEIEERYFSLTYYNGEVLNKTIFLTREEAEAALEVIKKDGGSHSSV